MSGLLAVKCYFGNEILKLKPASLLGKQVNLNRSRLVTISWPALLASFPLRGFVEACANADHVVLVRKACLQILALIWPYKMQ